MSRPKPVKDPLEALADSWDDPEGGGRVTRERAWSERDYRAHGYATIKLRLDTRTKLVLTREAARLKISRAELVGKMIKVWTKRIGK